MELNSPKNIAQFSSENEKYYKCPECEEWFLLRCELIEHCRSTTHVDGISHHYTRTRRKCAVKFDEMVKLWVGRRSKASQQTTSLKKSSPGRRGPRKRQHVCEYCGQQFSQARAIITHLRCHEDRPTHECRVCAKQFSGPCQLSRHVRAVHSDEKPHSCDRCGKHFAHAAYLKDHIKTHDRPYHCSECQRRFAQFTMLDRHMRTHTGEKPCECMQCGRPFANTELLRKHQQTHANGRPFKRWIQPFSSEFEQVMERDELQRPYACILCGDRFSQPGHLKNHTRSHSVNKLLKCPHCTVMFRYELSLQQHLKVHAEPTIHQCHICSKRFQNVVDLSVHIVSHDMETTRCGDMFGLSLSEIISGADGEQSTDDQFTDLHLECTGC